MSKQLVLNRLYRLPGEYVSVEDWNYLVQLVYTMWENIVGPFANYLSNDSLQGLNLIQGKIIETNMLTLNGYQALWNNKQVLVQKIYKLLQTLGEYPQLAQIETFYKVVPYVQPTLQKLPTLPSLSVQLQQLRYSIKLLARVLYAQLQRQSPPDFVASQNYLVSTSTPLTNLLPHPSNWREAVVKVLGPNTLVINNTIMLRPKECIKITVSNPSSVTFTSTQTYVSVLESVDVLPRVTPHTAYAITITNNQSTSTPAPFQQLLMLNLSGIISSPSKLLNLLFSSDLQGNSPLYAWVEQYSSDLSSVYIWVLLPNGVPANSSVTIYMHVMSTNQYPYTGISPLVAQAMSISPTQYDNGGNVFSYYQSFAGLSALPTGWQLIYNSGSSTFSTYYLNTGTSGTNNGVTTTNNYGGSGVAVDIIAQVNNLPSSNPGFSTMVIGLALASQLGNGVIGGGGGLIANGSPAIIFGSPFGTNNLTLWYNGIQVGSANVNPSAPQVFTIMQTNNTIYYEVNYTTPVTYSATPESEPITVANQYNSGPIYLYAVRTRATPPNGVMPSNGQPTLVTYYT